MHVVSDALIGLSYFSIPLALAYFVKKRPALHHRWVFWLFVAFITACGTTHLFSIYTLWVPDYVTEGLIKSVTAGVSAITALMLWWHMPAALAIPSRAQLENLNADLERQVRRTSAAEDDLRRMNADLESRVEERTREISAANLRLVREVAEREKAEARLSELLSELDHRVKNNLAVVLAIARQAGRNDPSLKEPMQDFQDRVFALAEIHRLLASPDGPNVASRPSWTDCCAPMAAGGRARWFYVGRRSHSLAEVSRLSGGSVAPIGMVFHELATNAAKYGALSTEEGRLSVTWSFTGDDPQTLHISWRETGVQSTVGGTARFGTEFVQNTITRAFHGAAERTVSEGTFQWDITVPWPIRQ